MIDSNAPEKDVKEAVKRLCRKHGAYWYMVVPGGYGRQTVDFHICHRGLFLVVETKKAGVDKPTPRQGEDMEAVRAAGGVAMLINARNLHELEAWLSEPV